MPKVTIDGIEYEVDSGKNVLQVVLDYKLDLPYFCWHAAMGSVGACRQCAIRVYKDESDTKGKIVMACMTPACDGLRASINDPEATEFRRYVIEWLMTNHPHDCPVCDEGGECHLQDMTVMCGHVYRRFRGRKRTHANQYLGPFVTHEMNRCIQCYRCVRFYRDLAGGRDFDVLGTRNRVYFGRLEDGVLESEFSGNLVEVCPTGVFTDKTLKRHYTRKWDLETAPSVCAHCGLGCNTIPGARYGELRRVHARYNCEVNGYFICDRGRYGYEFVNSDCRIRECSVDGSPASWDDALARAAEMLKGAKGVVGIGSPRASLESNHALKKLVGDDAFCTGLSQWEQDGLRSAIDVMRDVHSPSLAEIETADVIVILGADPTNEAPMLDFAIRQALRRARIDLARKLKIPDWDANAVATALQWARGKLYVYTPWRIKLEELAVGSARVSYGNLADLEMPEDVLAALRNARQPLIVSSISAGVDVVGSAARFAHSLRESGKECWLSIIAPEANTMGVGLLGGISADDGLARIESGEADTLVVLENDLGRRVSPAQLDAALRKVKHLIVLDCIRTSTAERAGVILSTPVFAECDGTLVNNESRAQRFYQVFVPRWESRPAWQTLRDVTLNLVQGPGEMLNQVQHDEPASKWSSYEDALRDLAAESPVFAPALEIAPPAGWRSAAQQKIARDPHRFSGRTAKDADVTLFEPEPPADPATPLAFTMEGDQNRVPGPLQPRYWWPGWNSVNSLTRFQTEVNGPLYEDNPGKRLVGPDYPHPNPLPSRERELGPDLPSGERELASGNEAWVVPRAAIFGSEELSALAPGIAELAPRPEITMHPELAHALGVKEGEPVQFDAGGRVITLPCRLDDTVAPDVAVIPAGVHETVGVVQPIRLDTGRPQ